MDGLGSACSSIRYNYGMKMEDSENLYSVKWFEKLSADNSIILFKKRLLGGGKLGNGGAPSCLTPLIRTLSHACTKCASRAFPRSSILQRWEGFGERVSFLFEAQLSIFLLVETKKCSERSKRKTWSVLAIIHIPWNLVR